MGRKPKSESPIVSKPLDSALFHGKVNALASTRHKIVSQPFVPNKEPPANLKELLLRAAEKDRILAPPKGNQRQHHWLTITDEWYQRTDTDEVGVSTGGSSAVDEDEVVVSTGGSSAVEEDTVLGRHMARCTCVCGKVVVYPYRWVTKNIKTSCGCQDPLPPFKTPEKQAFLAPRPHKNTKNLLGNEYGLLKVTAYLGNEELIATSGNRRTMARWELTCACGAVMQLLSRRFLSKPPYHCESDLCKRLYHLRIGRGQASRMLRLTEERRSAVMRDSSQLETPEGE